MTMTERLPAAHELATSRAKFYQFLAAVYARPPEPDFLEFLAGWVASVAGTDDTFLPLSKQIRHSFSRLDSFFKQNSQGPAKELAEALSVDFTRLFRGIKPGYSPLPPYESVYREEAGRVFDELTVNVHQEYLRFGFDLTNGLEGEPPDHISFELEFMYLLCRQEAEAWEREDEDEALKLRHAERNFLAEHLLAWLPRICDEMRKHDQLGFFSSLADLTEGWVNFDYQQHLRGNDNLSFQPR